MDLEQRVDLLEQQLAVLKWACPLACQEVDGVSMFLNPIYNPPRLVECPECRDTRTLFKELQK